HGGQGVERSQLANAVQQEDATGNGARGLPLGAPPEADTEVGNHGSYVLEALRVPRGEDHYGSWMSGQHGFEGAQEQRFFAFHGAAGHNDGRGFRQIKSGTQLLNNRWRRGCGDIELQVSSHLYAVRGGAYGE